METQTLLDDIDDLLAEVAETSTSIPITKKDSDEILYSSFSTGHRPPLERIHPELRDREVRLHETDLLRRLRDVRGINPLSLEITPPLDESEPSTTREAIKYTIGKIIEEKIIPTREKSRFLKDLAGENRYVAALEVIQEMQSVKTMMDGTSTGLDRKFFDFTDPDIEAGFFDLKREISTVLREADGYRKESATAILPTEEVEGFIKSGSLDIESLESTAQAINSSLKRIVSDRFRNNPNQSLLFVEMARDTLSTIKERETSDNETKLKVLMLEIPSRIDGWLKYKKLSALNQNYVGSGVANIALADDLISCGYEGIALPLLHETLESSKLYSLLEKPRPEDSARETFMSEISLIYDSRISIDSVLESTRGKNEIMTPKEAMFEISQLSGAMSRGETSEVMRIVEGLEGKKIDLYHVTANSYAFDQILSEGRLVSNWANKKFGDTFFGGGLYFWGAQQEDWLKGGDESIHVVFPMKDLFIIKNKYNNPQKGPFSERGAFEEFADSQKKSNLIAMIPANALKMIEHQNLGYRPRNNEGYSAGTIEDVTDFEVEQSNFIWRIDKHYGNYDTSYFISQETENALRELFGNNISIERNVMSSGFIEGEYDRLIIPRSVSILKATSVAYALRIAEVVYEDQLDALHLETKQQEIEDLQYFQEANLSGEPLNAEIEEFIKTIENNTNFDEKDKVVFRYYLSHADEEQIQKYIEELSSLENAIDRDFPTKEVVANNIPEKEWFNKESTIHGTPHILRVLIDMEILARLAQKSLPDQNIDLRSLEVATRLHDVKRLKDSASDFRHGERSAEFINQLIEESAIDLEGVDIELVKRIMKNHSLDDYEGMTLEEVIFKDADALDRYRFSTGPDLRYMRTPVVENMLHSAYNLASLSRFLLANGYRRSEAVIKAAEALKLIR